MQKVQVIDITKSYLPGDPNSYPENLISTDREDGEEKTMPVLPFEAYNVLPTAYGYRSYFGIDSTLTGDAVPNNCDQVILFQRNDFSNMMIAFTAAGVYTRTGAATAWTQTFPLTDTWTASSIYKEYTWTILDNDLYIYRQGHTHVLKISYNGTATSFVPTFLNMSGQMGIFKAHGRLGFWDSLNSVSWSSALDYTNFTPDLETLAGNCTFLEVQGRIVTIKDHGEGYVIYATKSIVGIGYNTQGTQLWDSMSLTQAGGIGYTKAVVMGENNKQHFAYTSIGIFMIGHFNALSRQYDMQPIAPELFDFLKESRDPVYLDCFGGRYLHFGLLDDRYLNGILSFNDVTSIPTEPPITYELKQSIAGPTTITAASLGNALSIPTADVKPLMLATYLTFDLLVPQAFVTNSAPDMGVNLITLTKAVGPNFVDIRVKLTIASTPTPSFSVTILDLGGGGVAAPFIDFGVLPIFPGQTVPVTIKPVNQDATLVVTMNGQQAAVAWTGADYNLYKDELDEIAAIPTGVHVMKTLEAEFLGSPAYPMVISNFKVQEEIPVVYFDFPPASFTLQSGSISPAYPIIKGSLVFDMQLKKWGKFVGDHKTLIALSPLNETQNVTIPYTNFGVDSGILYAADNTIRLFSPVVTNSLLKYGKIGFYRQGFSTAQEVILHFRFPATGQVVISGSLTGKIEDDRLTTTSAFFDAVEHVVYLDKSARWFNIAISGQFDLTYLEFRGTIAGRR